MAYSITTTNRTGIIWKFYQRKKKSLDLLRRMKSLVFNVVLIISLVRMRSTEGHGRLLQPPSRSSMWRYKYTDPMLSPYAEIIQSNYDDNGLNCGGKNTQTVNEGRCGVCGDSYTAAVKENEAGGKYALGIIGRCTTGLAQDCQYTRVCNATAMVGRTQYPKNT